MAETSLSKSTFIKGVQCFKALYLYKNRIFLRDKLSEEQKAKFDRGHAVGILAQQLFPGGTDVSPSSPSQYKKSLEATQKAISEGIKVIYEAAFRYKNTLIFLDMLVRDSEGWKAYEVKSSRSISETYLQDAALQYNVLCGTGLNITDFSIIHLNGSYIFDGKLQLNELFNTVSVYEKIQSMQSWVEEMREKAFHAIEGKNSPRIDIGKHCNTPYPCEFRGHCHKHLPRVSVLSLSLIPEENRYNWYYKGVFHLSDLVPDNDFTDARIRQLNSLKNNAVYQDYEYLQKMETQIQAPVFIAFFSVQAAVPFIPASSPFQSIPLQWSYTFAGTTHHETADFNQPVASFYHRLLSLATNHSIIVYDDTEIIEYLDYMKAHTPGLFNEPAGIIQKLVSIRKLIEQGFWCHPSLIPPASIETIASSLNCAVFEKGKERLRSSIIYSSGNDIPGTLPNTEIEDHNKSHLSVLLYITKQIFPNIGE
jgi:hypothetical protein